MTQPPTWFYVLLMVTMTVLGFHPVSTLFLNLLRQILTRFIKNQRPEEGWPDHQLLPSAQTLPIQRKAAGSVPQRSSVKEVVASPSIQAPVLVVEKNVPTLIKPVGQPAVVETQKTIPPLIKPALQPIQMIEQPQAPVTRTKRTPQVVVQEDLFIGIQNCKIQEGVQTGLDLIIGSRQSVSWLTSQNICVSELIHGKWQDVGNFDFSRLDLTPHSCADTAQNNDLIWYGYRLNWKSTPMGSEKMGGFKLRIVCGTGQSWVVEFQS